jgi:hypothetical protein
MPNKLSFNMFENICGKDKSFVMVITREKF